MKGPVTTFLRGGVAVIEAEADIRRPAEEVFDYASDPANELEWNIRVKRIQKLTGGPVGVGARYRMEFTQGPPAISECVRFERPGFWEHTGESKIISSSFSGRVVPTGDGSHLLLRMQVRPRGPLRLALPLVRRRMQRELARDAATVKARLEGAAQTSTGPRSYRRDIDAARRRLADRERRSLRDPGFGDIEYTVWGEGPPMILSHPLFGGFDMMTGFARTYIGAGHRFIAPSRFGYLGSSLPSAATPADQANSYALLLDTLGIDRAAVFGYSGGGPSAIQFALRHPGRTTALILMASALPGKTGAPPKVLAQALLGSDPFFWILKSYAPSLFARILGMPKNFHPTRGERGRIEQTMDSIFPIHPRKPGVLFDLYVSNPDVQTYPLEQLSVPTLIINAKDDGLSAFGNATQAARRMRRSKLVAIDRGGHLLLGSEDRIKEEIAVFETSAT
jgi:pimeloyl-ACP methyl ester carboxylesterase